MSSLRKPALAVSIAAGCIIALLAAPVSGRPWKPSPPQQASDYLTITHNRAGEVIILMWLAAPMMSNDAARQLFAQNVVIGVVDAHIATNGSMTFEPVTKLEVLDGGNVPLPSVTAETLSPAMAGVVTTAQTIYRQSLGAVGQGMHWFVFESGSVNACGKGRLSIPYAGEIYTYETPVPGCPRA